MKSKTIIVISFFIASFSFAQEKKWTLKECINHAITNNISIKQAELDAKNANINKKDAFGAFLPTLNGSANHGWSFGFGINPITNDRTNQTNQFSGFGLNGGFDIYNGLQNLNRYRKANLSIIASQYSLTKIQEDVALNVANAYLQILFNKENLKVQQQQLELDKKQQNRSKQLAEAGNIPKGDLLDIEATLATDKQRIIIAENTLLIAKLSLAQLLQIQDFKTFDVSADDMPSMLSSVLNESSEDIIAKAKQNRTDLKISKSNEELALKDIEIAKGAYMPRLGFTYGLSTNMLYNKQPASFIQDSQKPFQAIGFVQGTNQAVLRQNFLPVLGNASPFFKQAENNFGQNIGLNLSIPIFNGFATRNNVERSKVNYEKAKLAKSQQELEVERSVFTAYTDTKAAKESYEASLTIEKARKLSMEYAKERYEIGMMNVFDFNQAQAAFVNAQSEVLRTKYDFIFRVKILEFYFGIPLIEKQ
jgi:outer membrane protein